MPHWTEAVQFSLPELERLCQEIRASVDRAQGELDRVDLLILFAKLREHGAKSVEQGMNYG